jgi:hypothetical protein
VLALIAGRSVMLDAARASARARNLLSRGQVELGQFWEEVRYERTASRFVSYSGGVAQLSLELFRVIAFDQVVADCDPHDACGGDVPLFTGG